MAFEELPPEYAEFFTSGGELPANLQAEHDAAAAEAAAASPAPTPAPTPAPSAAPVATIDPPPPVPVDNPYADRLIAEKDARVAELAQQIEDLKSKINKANEPAPPDPNVDPLGSLQHQLKSLQTALDKMTVAQTEAQATTLQERQAQQFFTNVNGLIASFKETHADYDAAYKHLVSQRLSDYRDMGLTPSEASAEMVKEEMRIVQQAMARGKNPAEAAYSMAQRLGYKAAVIPPKPENKLDTLKKGLEASQSTERSAPPPTGKVTLEDIENMSDAEMNKAVENDWEGIFGKRKGIFG